MNNEMNHETKPGASTSRFQHVYDAVIEGIQRGEWREHGKLPSVRAMAARMGLHRLTVFKAYQRLKLDQIIYVKEKSGYYVVPRSLTPPPAVEAGADWAYEAESFYVNRSRMAEIQRIPVDYRLSEALIDPNLLPNAYLSDYVKDVFDMYPKVLGTYSSVQGDAELRESLAAYFTGRQGHMAVSAEELLITSGSQQAIDLVARALVRPGDAVLIERPTYSAAIDIFQQQHIRLLPVDITPDGYDLAQVEAWMRRAGPRLFYMNPTFHNPTGFTVPRAQRKQLVELAERYRCVLVEDDAFRDIYFEDAPPPPFFSYDTEGYVVYIRSFSKYIAPGLRISALAARPSLMRSLLPVKALLDNGTPLLNQKIFRHYFFSMRLQEHVAKLRIALQLRKEKMEQALSCTGWHWVSPKGGLNLWVRLPSSIAVDRLLARSIEESVSFVPGSICDALGGLDAWLRLSYSYANEAQLGEGVRRLIHAAQTLESRNDVTGG